MAHVRTLMLATLLVACATVAAAAPPAAKPATPAAVPSDSLYQLKLPLTSQAGKATALDRERGKPVLVTMFYGSCPHVCPMLISSMQAMERNLPEANRKKLRVLMVSIDPERDTPAHLTEVAERHRIDLTRWTLARAAPADVRRLAATLGIQYRQLPEGEFNHSTVITLLTPDGRIRAQTSSLIRPDERFNAELERATD